MLDLFSGIGGFHLAAELVWGDELQVVAHCDIEPFAQKVLRKHWPDVPIVPDIHDLRGDQFGPVDLVTGGFPCQPYSVAGKRRGAADDRALWTQMFRVIEEARPRLVLGENVAGFVSMGLDNSLADLESIGYTAWPVVIPACAVDAKHRRDRVWIVANTWSNGVAQYWKSRKNKENGPGKLQGYDVREFWPAESAVGRVAHGISNRVDRLKGLGNAIVPQVAVVIMQAMKWM